MVDDDPALVRALSLTLRASGWDVVAAARGGTAVRMNAEQHPDVIVLDLGLPDMDGVEVLRHVRRISGVPVVVLSARSDSTDKVRALDAGADDFVTKPFGVEELLARLRAAVRRGAPVGEPLLVRAGDLLIDVGGKRVQRAGEDVRLTPTEWSLLEVLVRRRGQLVTHRELLQLVWGPAYRTESNYLRVYAAQLRRKLEADPSRPQHLITEPGLGYRFEGAEDDNSPR